MKRPISWHEQCLNNRRLSFIRKTLDFEVMKTSLYYDKIAIQFLEQQIERAKKKKKDGFDSEKFLVSRAKHRTTAPACQPDGQQA